MKNILFAFLALLSLTAFDAAGDKTVPYKRVQSAKVPASFYAKSQQQPRFKNALRYLENNRVAAKPGFKLYNYHNVSILVKDEGDKLDVVISGYDIDIIDTVGDFIIVAICACPDADEDDDCTFVETQGGDIDCQGGACSDCRAGFEVWGPDGGLAPGTVQTPF
ncbi:MAG: hypothetical protein OHK0039_05900 [Bacteroidia bacterium]